MSIFNTYYLRPETTGEKNTLPSMTIPDQSMTIRQLLERNARGLPVTGSHYQPIFHGTEFHPDLKTMDLSEIHEHAKRVENQIKYIQQELNRKEHQKRESENEKKIIANYEQKKAQENLANKLD